MLFFLPFLISGNSMAYCSAESFHHIFLLWFFMHMAIKLKIYKSYLIRIPFMNKYSFCTNEQIQAVEDKIIEKKNAIENDL